MPVQQQQQPLRSKLRGRDRGGGGRGGRGGGGPKKSVRVLGGRGVSGERGPPALPKAPTKPFREVAGARIVVGSGRGGSYTYTGTVKVATGFPHGKGTQTFPDGARFDGTFFDGLREGKGLYVFSDGNVYAGNFKAGKEFGLGTYRWTSGATYTGYFKNDNFHGKKKWRNGIPLPRCSSPFSYPLLNNQQVAARTSRRTAPWT